MRSVGAVLLSKQLGEPSSDKNRKTSFLKFFEEAFSMCSDDRRARKELYKVPGGSQADSLPPVPVPSWLSGFWTLPSGRYQVVG
eukprot:1234023-Pyramimonas_sp.AAC.1